MTAPVWSGIRTWLCTLCPRSARSSRVRVSPTDSLAPSACRNHRSARAACRGDSARRETTSTTRSRSAMSEASARSAATTAGSRPSRRATCATATSTDTTRHPSTSCVTRLSSAGWTRRPAARPTRFTRPKMWTTSAGAPCSGRPCTARALWWVAASRVAPRARSMARVRRSRRAARAWQPPTARSRRRPPAEGASGRRHRRGRRARWRRRRDAWRRACRGCRARPPRRPGVSRTSPHGDSSRADGRGVIHRSPARATASAGASAGDARGPRRAVRLAGIRGVRGPPSFHPVAVTTRKLRHGVEASAPRRDCRAVTVVTRELRRPERAGGRRRGGRRGDAVRGIGGCRPGR